MQTNKRKQHKRSRQTQRPHHLHHGWLKEGGGTQTKSMVNYSPNLPAIHYTACIIYHMASNRPCKPEQLLCPAWVKEASCNTSHKTNAPAVTWARQQRHRRENKGTHTCRQKLEQAHTRCVAAASSIRAVTHVKRGEDTDALVIIADLHHYSSLKSTDACLEVLPFQTI